MDFDPALRLCYLWAMDPPIDQIVANLRLSPASLAELAFGLPKIKPRQIRLVVNALRREGLVVQLEGRDDEGRPVFALADYVEASGWHDHSDIVLGRDYGGQYERVDGRDL